MVKGMTERNSIDSDHTAPWLIWVYTILLRSEFEFI